MGSFSWIRAEHTTDRANLTIGDRFKVLVPQEFGGGYILDTYFDYGQLFVDETFFRNCGCTRNKAVYVDGTGKKYPMSEFVDNPDHCNPEDNKQCHCDLYAILAYWNNAKRVDGSELEYFGEAKPKTMYEILKNGLTWVQENRCAGIHIGCYNKQIDKLKYPLKLVSATYKGTYETCKGKSYGDREQGFDKRWWKDCREELEKLEQLEAED